jgi:hypothetical protein
VCISENRQFDSPNVPRPPTWAAPDWRHQLDKWLAELNERCRDPEWVRAYVATYCPPPAPVNNFPNANDAAQREWERLQAQHHRLLRAPAGESWRMPPPYEGEDLRRHIATYVSPRTRELLRETILDLIAPDILAMVTAATKEAVHAA